jgi:hypothetical protein
MEKASKCLLVDARLHLVWKIKGKETKLLATHVIRVLVDPA